MDRFFVSRDGHYQQAAPSYWDYNPRTTTTRTRTSKDKDSSSPSWMASLARTFTKRRRNAADDSNDEYVLGPGDKKQRRRGGGGTDEKRSSKKTGGKRRRDSPRRRASYYDEPVEEPNYEDLYYYPWKDRHDDYAAEAPPPRYSSHIRRSPVRVVSPARHSRSSAGGSSPKTHRRARTRSATGRSSTGKATASATAKRPDMAAIAAELEAVAGVLNALGAAPVDHEGCEFRRRYDAELGGLTADVNRALGEVREYEDWRRERKRKKARKEY